MGNVLKQARERHLDLRTGRYTYNSGSFWDDNNELTSHLMFDLGSENPVDPSISREECAAMMPEVTALTVTSKPNTPSLYNTTPNVLLGHAPYLTYVHISRVNGFDIPIIERMFPLLQGAAVHLHWNHLRVLGERNPSVFQNVSSLNLEMTDHGGVTPESLRFLHEWASSGHALELDLNIEKWTGPLQTMFSEFDCPTIHNEGLTRLHISVGEMDPDMFETKFNCWNRFIRNRTKVRVTIKNVPRTTRRTVTWLSEMLKSVMKKSGDVLVSITLCCDKPDWHNIIDPLVVRFVGLERDAYLRAKDLEYVVLPPDYVVDDDWEDKIFSKLHITVNVPAGLPHALLPHNTNRRKWTTFTNDLEITLFLYSRVVIDMQEGQTCEESNIKKRQRE